MRLIELKATNFRSFETLHLDESFFKNDKYLFVGKNGSGKTTILEVIRMALALDHAQQNTGSPQYFSFLKDNTKAATIELRLELDDEETVICQEYLDRLNSEGSPPWNEEEKRTYDLDPVTKSIVSRITIDPINPMPGSGQGRMANVNKYQTYISEKTDGNIDQNGAQARKYHILRKLLSESRDKHKPIIYINPFRAVQITEPQLFQNFGVVQAALNPSPGQVTNDPVASANVNAPEYAKTYYQYNYNHELYGGVTGELYKLATDPKTHKKLEKHILKEMKDINELIAPKAINSINIDKDSNFLFYQVSDGVNKYPITSMSAGEEQLVIFALTLPQYLNSDKTKIKPMVLIDEPEVHLHPEFSKRLGKFLNAKLNIGSSQQLFMASHSVEIVQELASDAYQISSAGVSRIEDINSRATLFNEMGSSFSIADLISKVVFVEGSYNSKNLKDSDFYQLLANDPYSKKVRFMGLGGKSSVSKIKAGGDEWRNFVASEVGKLGDGNLYAILDGDILNWTLGNNRSTDTVFYLPCYSFENLLTLPDVMLRAFSGLKKVNFDTYLASIKDDLIKHTRDNKLIGELDRSKESLFGMGGAIPPADIEVRFKRELKKYINKKKKIVQDYYTKASASSEWYLYVDGKAFLQKLAVYLKVKPSVLKERLLKEVLLSDLPQSMQDWFSANITN